MAKGEEHWCVDVLVMRGTSGDDSVEQSNTIREWFDHCGADFSSTEKNVSRVVTPSVERSLQSCYPQGNYKGVEAFGTLKIEAPLTPEAEVDNKSGKSRIEARGTAFDTLKRAITAFQRNKR